MTERERSADAVSGIPPEGDRIEVEDSGETLEGALAEEERSAIAATEDKLRSVQRDLEELKDRHVRKLAEFENMRKRNDRERREFFRAALASFAKEFLPILDNFERAMAHASAEDRRSDFGQGIGLIRRQLAELWSKHGLTEVDTSLAFDPNIHEAVATETTDEVAPNTILEVLQKGYLVNDRLIRPALVKVSVRPNAGTGQPERDE